MAFPILLQKLFDEGGGGNKLRQDIIPPSTSKTANELNNFTGAIGEITYNTTEKRIVAHDGETAGGIPMAKKSEVDAIDVGVTSINGNKGDITPEQTGCLPSSGGTMTGAIKTSSEQTLSGSDNTKRLHISGGTDWSGGSHLILTGKDSSSNGDFALVAKNNSSSCALNGYPNGALTWRGNDVITSAGGTIWSKLNFNDIVALARTQDASYMQINGGTQWGHGASLNLTGKDSPEKGSFNVTAHDGSNQKLLVGSPTGSLTWGDNSLALKPDFNSLVWINYLPWTAPIDCFVMVCVTRAANSSEHGCVTVNGLEIFPFQNVSGNMVGDFCTQFWVKAGDVISVSRNAQLWQGCYCGGRF